MNRVGDRDVIYSETFVVQKGESIQLSATFDGGCIPVEINIFEEQSEDGAPATWKSIEGKLHLNFFGFVENATRIMQMPAKIGVIGNNALTFSTSISRHFNAFLVHIQFMTGGSTHV